MARRGVLFMYILLYPPCYIGLSSLGCWPPYTLAIASCAIASGNRSHCAINCQELWPTYYRVRIATRKYSRQGSMEKHAVAQIAIIRVVRTLTMLCALAD
ncbi:hypothetical protein DAEQUDRAFT_330068 [Daedalea quercina L-15889]|uniref:Secreted protein n=1 Tax=Daedalea quercina L-15889 TaxID=1314783 RepID=A0A165PQV5_9APHY|nr:hypothetical protein DAEQUDRAFT_330068 [Daedalea quercina L-15889]